MQRKQILPTTLILTTGLLAILGTGANAALTMNGVTINGKPFGSLAVVIRTDWRNCSRNAQRNHEPFSIKLNRQLLPQMPSEPYPMP
ncbi:MAG: hypothetical protein IGS54_14555 [Elainella sp. C42_A2020_010]|nr:hypothetical protein [Elainella sp. C42_A2020_010]RNJ66142.1 MAG: hypothetical protein EDM05_27315 [Leptolyngbya sp. IPPAS B-1204]